MDTHLPPNWKPRLLSLLGAGIGHENLRFLEAQQRAEGGDARWNPLNTTWQFMWSTDYNTTHVQNYRHPIEGLCATALTLADNYDSSGKLRFGLILGTLQGGGKTAEEMVTICEAPLRIWGTNPDVMRQLLREIA